MTLVDYAYELFEGIKQKQFTFAQAINKKINTMSLSSSEILIVKDALKGMVNHYYFLKWEINNNIKVNSVIENDYLILCLAFARYSRNITIQDVNNFLSESYNEKGFTFDLENAKACIEKIGKNPTALPDSYDKNFVKTLSLTYSYPEWLVGMIRKHFGNKNAFKSIASSRRSTPLNVCINSQLITNEEMVDNSFRKIDISTTSYEYLSKSPLIENELFKEKKVFVLDATDQLLADEIDPFQGDEILVYGGSKGALCASLAARLYDFGKIHCISETYETSIANKKILKSLNVKSVYAYDSTLELLCTNLKEEQVDKIILFPPSSEFGYIRRKPEILITFDQNDLDGIIARQKEYINEISKYVKKGGTLVYSVPTLNIKESFAIVHDFLETNSDFELLDEKEIFPYIYQTTGMYYAKLIKKQIQEEKEDND